MANKKKKVQVSKKRVKAKIHSTDHTVLFWLGIILLMIVLIAVYSQLNAMNY